MEWSGGVDYWTGVLEYWSTGVSEGCGEQLTAHAHAANSRFAPLRVSLSW